MLRDRVLFVGFDVIVNGVGLGGESGEDEIEEFGERLGGDEV